MYAAFNNHPACVKLLLEYGADLTLRNEDDYMAIDLAVGQGHKAGKLLLLIELMCMELTLTLQALTEDYSWDLELFGKSIWLL